MVKIIFLLKRLLLKGMNVDEKHMLHCLELAKKGLRDAAPNPSVGAILVFENTIIGEGYTSAYGGSHAEVNCINAVLEKDIHLIPQSTLYVSLEPCSHYGKTPPCSELIIEKNIPKVVIGCVDVFSEVNGKGIQHLKDAGIEVIFPLLEKESREVNKRFFTYHTEKRPYIILKWAETEDGFIDIERPLELISTPLNQQLVDNWITTPASKKLVHQWRSEEQSIMVGTNTALNDNPALTVRDVDGKNPLRIVLDLNLRLPETLQLFDQSTPTIVFNYQKEKTIENLTFIKISDSSDVVTTILQELYQQKIQSVIIEGGAQLLNTFINKNLWDEARVFKGIKQFKTGLKAPTINKKVHHSQKISSDTLNIYMND